MVDTDAVLSTLEEGRGNVSVERACEVQYVEQVKWSRHERAPRRLVLGLVPLFFCCHIAASCIRLSHAVAFLSRFLYASLHHSCERHDRGDLTFDL